MTKTYYEAIGTSLWECIDIPLGIFDSEEEAEDAGRDWRYWSRLGEGRDYIINHFTEEV